MKRWSIFLTLVLTVVWATVGPAMAASTHQGHADVSTSGSGTVAHAPAPGTFTHRAVEQGIRAEFQVMSLASMNMKDPEGNTHHIMVKFTHEGMNHQIDNAVGKIKVISPSGKEQMGSLKNYSGIYAANFTFTERGNYGVICLFKVDGQQRLVKFWYPHE